MKFVLRACLLLGALAAATQVVAAPMFAPFLSVDMNGANAGGGEVLGPTQAGFEGITSYQGFDQFDPAYDPAEDWGNSGVAGLTKVFSTAEGNVTVNVSGRGTGSPIARNRGNGTEPFPPFQQAYQDIVFMTRGLDGFGQNWIRVHVSGLDPGQEYEFTGLAREPFNGGLTSFQAWTDIDALGGLDGPGAWMNANVGANAVYGPLDANPVSYKNPIPYLHRTRISGPNPVDAYDYASRVITTADGTGAITVYTWADPNSFSGTQTATAFNGFQLSLSPEPTSAVLLMIGMSAVAVLRRRSTC